MIAHIKRGRGFRGVLNYCLGPSKEPEIVTHAMASKTARELAAEFGISRSLRPGCEKPVWHTSLSLSEGETLTHVQWDAAVRTFLTKIGLDPDDHQYVAVLHKDTTHEHVHIVASRIGLGGKLWYGANDAQLVYAATQEIEREMGLKQTPVRQTKSKSPRLRISQPELDMVIRKEKNLGRGGLPLPLPPKAEVAAALDDILARGNGTIEDLVAQMGVKGIEVRVNKSATTGRVSGLSFALERGGEVCTYKASQISKGYSWGTLGPRLAARLAEVEAQQLGDVVTVPPEVTAPQAEELPPVESPLFGPQKPTPEQELQRLRYQRGVTAQKLRDARDLVKAKTDESAGYKSVSATKDKILAEKSVKVLSDVLEKLDKAIRALMDSLGLGTGPIIKR